MPQTKLRYILLIPNGKHVTLISRQIGLQHNFDTSHMMLMALHHIHENPWGGDLDGLILKMKTYWIYLLKVTQPPALHEIFNYKRFQY